MTSRQRDLVDRISQISPLVQCVMVIAFSVLLILIMLYPAAGTALTSFLLAISLIVERFRYGRLPRKQEQLQLPDQD